MAAEYDFIERPNPEGDGQKQLLYPRIVVRDTIKSDEFIERVSRRTTFTASEVKAVMRLMSETMTELLREGYRVELEELGFFTPSLTSRPVETKKEIRAASVKMDSVNFLPCKVLKQEIKSAPLSRARYGFNKSSEKYTLEERKALLDAFLNEHGLITRTEYSNLTGLLQNKALKDLNGWVKEGYLKTKGVKSTRMFLKSVSS